MCLLCAWSEFDGICRQTPTTHIISTIEPLYVISIKYNTSIPDDGSYVMRNMLEHFNLLNPTGYVMHHQLNIQLFCIYLRTNSDLCHLQHKLIGFYNRDEKCLQRGTDWVFK